MCRIPHIRAALAAANGECTHSSKGQYLWVTSLETALSRSRGYPELGLGSLDFPDTVAAAVSRLEACSALRGHPSFRVSVADVFSTHLALELLSVTDALMAHYPFVRLERLHLSKALRRGRVGTTYPWTAGWATLKDEGELAGLDDPWEAYESLRSRRPKVPWDVRQRARRESKSLPKDGPRSVQGDAEIHISLSAENHSQHYLRHAPKGAPPFLLPVITSDASRALIHEFGHALQAALERLNICSTMDRVLGNCLGDMAQDRAPVVGRYGASSTAELFAESFVLAQTSVDMGLRARYWPFLDALLALCAPAG
jgi:hypothetical protein